MAEEPLLLRGVQRRRASIRASARDGNPACIWTAIANCIIPTNQNMANLNHDMQQLLLHIIDKPQDEVRLTLEMLVRAYDPCISCSAHFLTVEFV